jgi:hypothetical protein
VRIINLLTVILTFMELCIARFVFYITNETQVIQCSLLLSALYMFRAVFSAHHQELIKLYAVPTHPHKQKTAGKRDNTQGYAYSFISS